jgi:transposase
VISLAPGTKVFLACRPVDLRNGFDGLAAKAQQVIGADPFSGHLFIFRGKRGDYFKGLYWDGSGMWLIAKRPEKGRFVWPPVVDGAMTLTPAQFSLLVVAAWPTFQPTFASQLWAVNGERRRTALSD